jgi:hypothetical protein
VVVPADSKLLDYHTAQSRVEAGKAAVVVRTVVGRERTVVADTAVAGTSVVAALRKAVGRAVGREREHTWVEERERTPVEGQARTWVEEQAHTRVAFASDTRLPEHCSYCQVLDQ